MFARRKQQDKRGGSDGGRPANAETGFLPSTSPPHGRRIDLPPPLPPPSRLPRNLRRPLTPWPPPSKGASCPAHLFLPPPPRPPLPPPPPPPSPPPRHLTSSTPSSPSESSSSSSSSLPRLCEHAGERGAGRVPGWEAKRRRREGRGRRLGGRGGSLRLDGCLVLQVRKDGQEGGR